MIECRPERGWSREFDSATGFGSNTGFGLVKRKKTRKPLMDGQDVW